MIRLGLVLLVLSLFAGRLAEPVLSRGGWGPGEWPYELKVIAKQGAELGGWMLIAFALVSIDAAARTARPRKGAAEDTTSRWASRVGREPVESAVGTRRASS
jgi:hypothetical protein